MLKHLFLFLCLPLLSSSQKIDIDVFGGMANYQGDLRAQFFTFQDANPAAAIILKYGFSDKLYIRTGFTFASLAAFDKDNLKQNIPRNLNFRTALQEYTLGLEYRLFSPETIRITPYVFAGGGIFHYNPYTYYFGGGKTERVNLQPLGTEGQGLPEYPDRKPYSLTQFCVPYGAGIKWQVTCNLNIGFELRQTKTFTDYIDDVSTTYVDQNVLLAAKGPIAVGLAWRQDEYDGRPYPVNGKPRGNPGQGDLYYFAGLTVGLKLNDCGDGGFSLGGLFGGEHSLFRRSGSGNGRSKRIRSQVGCPKF